MTKLRVWYNIRQMRKVVISLLVLITIVLFGAREIRASEGVVKLEPTTGEASCYALSVYDDGRFEVLLSCQDLKTPFSSQLNRYMLWVEDEQGEVARLGEIDRGKFEGSIGKEFTKMFISAESKRTPRKPSDQVVMEGRVESIPFVAEGQEEVKEEASQVEEEAEEEISPVEEEEEQPAAKGGVLRTVGRVFLAALAILVGVVIVVTVVARRKGGV